MKTCVAVLFGCVSVEHEISVISAVQAMHSMNREKYDILPIYVAKDGQMYTGDVLLDMNAYKNTSTLLAACRPVYLLRQNGQVVMQYLNQKRFKKEPPVAVDVAFPVVHGTNCEDGTIAGYLRMLGLPFVGCDVLSAALCMDKAASKRLLAAAGLPVLPCITFSSREYLLNKEEICKKIEDNIGYPVIIKPVNLGSSVGISKADTPAELRAAVDLACSFAKEILAEHAVTALREINCSVLGEGADCEASALEEPVMHDKILSYDDKYRSGNKGSKGMASLSRKLPADLPAQKAEEIRSIAKKTFAVLGCSGVVRIDFLMDGGQEDKVYINEINTIPGSLSFYLWEATGMPYAALLDRLIDLAFKRARSDAELMFTIDTNILSEGGFKFGGKNGGKL